MNKVIGFKCLISLLGSSILLYGSYRHIDNLMVEDMGLIVLFILLSTLLERMEIPLPKGSLTLSFAFVFCTFFVFQNVLIPVWIVVIALLITQLVFHKRKIIDALFNIGILSSTFITGGVVYNLLGGTWESVQYVSAMPILGMVMTNLLVNHLILGIYFRMIDKTYDLAKLINDVKWDAMTYLITVPLGLLMVLFYNIGVAGVLIAFIPLITSSYIFRLYRKVDQLNSQLNGLYEVATDINSNLDMDKTMDSIGEHLYQILKVDSFYILLVKDNKLSAVYSKGEMEEYFEKSNLEIGQGAAGYCAKYNETVLIEDASKDDRVFTMGNNNVEGSILAVPLQRKGSVIGVLCGTKFHKNGFSKTDVLLLEIMASQAAVALDNARTFKEIENMTIIDELTKLYNYRYFQQKIQQEVEKAALDGVPISLMVIDLDDFKGINDTFGHTAGNKVLIEIAQILRKSIRKYDVLFRYGGDEFVVIFPNTDKSTAEIIGKRILESINKASFGSSEGVEGKVTFSAGIAEFPTDAEDHIDLMRKADRIMYVGSKEQGKNKITVYTKREA